VKRIVFATAQEAEQAFYGAFQQADLDAMMGVWAEDEEVYCVHPSGPRLSGIDQVRASWRQLFANGATLRFQLRHRHCLRVGMLAVHSVYEQITAVGSRQGPALAIATNVYQNTESGWRMIAHHASPVPGVLADDSPPGVLH